MNDANIYVYTPVSHSRLIIKTQQILNSGLLRPECKLMLTLHIDCSLFCVIANIILPIIKTVWDEFLAF